MRSKAPGALFLALTVAACSGLVSAASHRGFGPVPCLNVVDAHGRTVGTVVDFLEMPSIMSTEAVTVATEVRGQAILLYVSRDGVFLAGPGDAGNSVLFTTPDCTGTPYIQTATPTSLVPRAAIAGPSPVTLFVERPGASPSESTFQSVLNPFASCAFLGAATTSAVEAVSRGTLQFQPPLRAVAGVCKGRSEASLASQESFAAPEM